MLRRQRGVSLVELMVGLAISLVLVAAAVAVYARALQGSATSGNLVQLNQAMRSIMNVMEFDIRRAGYSASAAAGTTNNTFSTRSATGTDLYVSSTNAPTAVNDCILYSFDLDSDGAFAANKREIFGFRYNRATRQVEVLNQSPTATGKVAADWTSQSCADPNLDWQALNLPDTVQVTALSFSTEGSQCLAFSPETYTPNDPATFARWTLTGTNTAAACDLGAGGAPAGTYAAATGTTFPLASTLKALVEVRQVTVRLVAQHARDTTLTRTLTHTIRVRNDRATTL